MDLIRGLHHLRCAPHGCVATIGNFDGVHRGHQAVLAQLRRISAELALPVTVIVFEPQPQEFFQPDNVPPRITRWREKFEVLCGYGMDRMVCLRFDAQLAALSPRAFVETVLAQGLGVRHLVMGEDFRFGKGRAGDYALLETLGKEFGFHVDRAETFFLDGKRVSSTWLRQVLAEGDFETARRLLGRPYSLSGRVAHGAKRGRELGFATANIDLHRRQSPLSGIFAAKVQGLADEKLDCVAYIGSRPAVGGGRVLLEVHVFDYDEECYGRHVHVDFMKKLREDRNFDSLEALQRQIALDVAQAREALKKPALRKSAA
jgi:riboflavin kinase/FMN adenylyltransferase